MVLKLTAGCGMKIGKSQVTDVTKKSATIIRRDRDKHSEGSGMARVRQM